MNSPNSGKSTKAYPDVLPHDDIVELFPDVWMVQGSIQVGPGMTIQRNMIILRSEERLILIHPVRLNLETEEKLKQLGEIRHVMRLGPAHGRDDLYYVETFGAEFWGQEGSRSYPLPKIDHDLNQETELPIKEAELFLFEKTRYPECAILLKQQGGLLLTCDSLQCWTDCNYCSLLSRFILRIYKFGFGTMIGPIWLKVMTKKGPGNSLLSDFQRLQKLPFTHFIGAHGTLCRHIAQSEISKAIAKTFKIT